MFYKRVVANKLFGKVFTQHPEFFPVYCLITLVAAAITHEVFIKNKKVQEISKAVSAKLADVLTNN